MNQTFRYILIALGTILALYLVWVFSGIVAYILISVVLAFIGRPFADLLDKIKIRKKKMPRSVSAAIVLLSIWIFFIAFFLFVIPLISRELDNLSHIDSQSILDSLSDPIHKLETAIDKYKINDEEEFTVQQFVTSKLVSIFNVSFLTVFLSNLAGTLGNLFIAIFSISFITFFFLKDEHLFINSLLAIVPDKYVDAFQKAMSSARRLLGRYFIGIVLQITGIFTLVTIGLTIVGVGFSHSLLIALIAAILNVIPYLGPLLGAFIGIVLGIATHIQLDFYTQLIPLVGLIALVFVIVQLTDNFLFQPLIFSNSVNAHPLEVFLVILIAGSVAGIPGMILAIPAYTVLRVFAKEFLNKFKVVKKLTDKL